MTQNSDFKEKVRALQEKTGMSYVAARAHLLSWRARECGQDICRWRCNKRCVTCGKFYCRFPNVMEDYFRHPTDYSRGSVTHCLACWLGVGPKDIEEWVRQGQHSP